METKWITYDGIDFYDTKRFEWKKMDIDWEMIKLEHQKQFKELCELYFPVFNNEKQVENGM